MMPERERQQTGERSLEEWANLLANDDVTLFSGDDSRTLYVLLDPLGSDAERLVIPPSKGS